MGGRLCQCSSIGYVGKSTETQLSLTMTAAFLCWKCWSVDRSCSLSHCSVSSRLTNSALAMLARMSHTHVVRQMSDRLRRRSEGSEDREDTASRALRSSPSGVRSVMMLDSWSEVSCVSDDSCLHSVPSWLASRHIPDTTTPPTHCNQPAQNSLLTTA